MSARARLDNDPFASAARVPAFGALDDDIMEILVPDLEALLLVPGPLPNGFFLLLAPIPPPAVRAESDICFAPATLLAPATDFPPPKTDLAPETDLPEMLFPATLFASSPFLPLPPPPPPPPLLVFDIPAVARCCINCCIDCIFNFSSRFESVNAIVCSCSRFEFSLSFASSSFALLDRSRSTLTSSMAAARRAGKAPCAAAASSICLDICRTWAISFLFSSPSFCDVNSLSLLMLSISKNLAV